MFHKVVLGRLNIKITYPYKNYDRFLTKTGITIPGKTGTLQNGAVVVDVSWHTRRMKSQWCLHHLHVAPAWKRCICSRCNWISCPQGSRRIRQVGITKTHCATELHCVFVFLKAIHLSSMLFGNNLCIHSKALWQRHVWYCGEQFCTLPKCIDVVLWSSLNTFRTTLQKFTLYKGTKMRLFIHKHHQGAPNSLHT